VTIRPIAASAVDISMKRAGFSIQRTSDTVVAWRKDLPGSYMVLSFGDHELYGEPHIKKWTLIHAEDDPSLDAKVRKIFELDLLGAIEAAKEIEDAQYPVPSPASPRLSIAAARRRSPRG
jgi:hypothetical protein